MFINFLNIKAGQIKYPKINTEPRVYMPKIQCSLNKKDDKLTSITSFTGQNDYKHVSIDFSLDYHYSKNNSKENIENNFNLFLLQVSLIQYRKKSLDDEKYNIKYEPKSIILPRKLNEYSSMGFKLFINSNIYEKKKNDLNIGCQHIALISNKQNNSFKSLIKTIGDLKNLLLLKDKNPEDYAYQFILEPNLIDGESKNKEIKTIFFNLEFDDFMGINLNVVDEINYHLE